MVIWRPAANAVLSSASTRAARLLLDVGAAKYEIPETGTLQRTWTRASKWATPTGVQVVVTAGLDGVYGFCASAQVSMPKVAAAATASLAMDLFMGSLVVGNEAGAAGFELHQRRQGESRATGFPGDGRPASA